MWWQACAAVSARRSGASPGRCSRGWISRKYVKGWIKEPQTDPRLNYWYIENGSYPMSIVRDINGCDFAFDKNGWMIEKERITGAGVVLY